MLKKILGFFRSAPPSNSSLHPIQRKGAFPLPAHLKSKRTTNIPYSELLAKAKTNSAGVDFLDLRLAHVESPEYAPYQFYVPEQMALKNAMQRSDLPRAIKAVEHLLEKYYLDIRTHMVAAFLYDKAGKVGESAFHRQFAERLFKSILSSGDGNGFETAYLVINLGEEHSVIEMVGMKTIRQSLQVNNGSEFDVMEAITPLSQQKLEFYFNIDLPKGWLNQQHTQG